MTSAESKYSIFSSNLLRDPPDFSVVQGGLLFQFLRQTRLSDDALSLLCRRIIAISLFCWLPLLALSGLDGNMLSTNVAIPFLLDVETQLKFLLAIPLLIAAELMTHRCMLPLVKQFMERHLIPNSAMTRFNDAIASTYRLRNSLIAEVLLIGFVYGVGILFVWPRHSASDLSTWYSAAAVQGSHLSLPGMWYAYVSLPFFQFLLLRWYYRIFIWARFLWIVSRIELCLVSTHPDRVGGLGFLCQTAYASLPLMMAHGVLMSGFMANRILYFGATLPGFGPEVSIVVLFLLFIALGPLLVFAPQLARARFKGYIEYGALAGRYVREFDAKWLRNGAPASEALIGSGDIQSLADMGNGFAVVEGMRIVMVTKQTFFLIVAAILAPIMPLVFTMIPPNELLKKLIGVLF